MKHSNLSLNDQSASTTNLTRDEQAISEDSAYSETLFEDNYPPGMSDHFWVKGRNRVIERAVRKLDTSGTILDIGCGPGLVVEYLRQHGHNCLGVELGAAPIPPQLSGYIHTQTDVAALPISLRKSVETALLLDVIEHIENPQEFLMHCRRCLPHLKQLVITVPARKELWSNYDDHFGHFRRYTRTELDELLATCDMSSRSTKYFFHWMYLPLLFTVGLSRKARRVQVKPPYPVWLHSLLATLTDVDEWLIPGSFLGSSILSIVDLH